MPKETQETIKKQILSAKQNIVMLQKKIVFLTAKAKSVSLEPSVPEKKKKSKYKKTKAANWGLPNPSTANLAAAYEMAQNTGVIQKLQDSFLQPPPPPPPPPKRYSIW